MQSLLDNDLSNTRLGNQPSMPAPILGRFFAWLLEVFVFGLALAIILTLIVNIMAPKMESEERLVAMLRGFQNFFTLVYCIYAWVTEGGETRGSFGRKIFGIQIVRKGSREPVGFGLYAIRAVLKVVFLCFFGINYIVMLFSSDKQALQDKILGIEVIKA